MSKKKLFIIILAAAILGLFLDIFAGRYLTAKISTWPLLNKWKILSPEAPIVINNHETVRVSDTGDVTAAMQQVKSKISSVIFVNNSTDVYAGAAINLTSDGSFVTAAGAFTNKPAGNYFVVLNDGTTAKIASTTADLATGLVFFKAALNSVPAASLGDSSAVLAGDKILFVQSSLQSFGVKIAEDNASYPQSDVLGQLFQSDYPDRSFGIATSSGLALGEAAVDSSGNILGIWNGNQIISADVLKQAQNLYFSNPQNIVRPSFGFSYSIVGKTDSALTGLPQGALIKQVALGSSAQKAGLAAGDVITQVSGQAITESSPLELALQNFNPGDPVSLVVMRKDQTLNLILTVGTLK
jgi:S1-C subfamily serine protease